MSERKKIRILMVIASIRHSFPDSVRIYTQGYCYQFFGILKTIFPEAIAYDDRNHVITRIGKHYYDITGEVKRERHEPMLPEDHAKYNPI